jgi:hypothetical protein
LKKKPILLIDEFEGLTKKQEFNDDVFDTLRSLGNNGHIAYVTASLSSLKTLCEKGKFTSPFYNIFSEVKLGRFSPEETMDFLSTRGESFGFDQGEIEFVYGIADNHPLHLQIACYHVYKNRGKKWDEQKLRGDIESEIKTYDDEEVRKKRHPEKLDEDKENGVSTNDDPKEHGLRQMIRSFIDRINPAATIASFIGFILFEIFEIIPGYNKHAISIAGAAVLFFVVLLLAHKKK